MNLPPLECILVGALATVTAGGKTSPDFDQTKTYRILLPKQLEGHRKLTHWWGWPAIALLGIIVYWYLMNPQEWWFPVLVALIVGWTSHVVIDWVFGDAGYGRGAGVPMSPLGNHRGLLGRKNGFKSDGMLAKLMERIVFPTACMGITLFVFAGMIR
jgi:membrane-bound metal-dependent hydrolase YbcI (DUF457 family)